MTTTGPAGAVIDARTEPAPPGLAGDPHRGDLRVRPRRRLPGSRAVVGGLLIALSALGVLVAYTDATAGPTTRYLVAAHALEPGRRLEPGDVRAVAMSLPGEVAAGAFTDPDALLGATTLGPLAEGDLVQAGGLIRQGGAAGTRQLSFPVEADLALGGALRPGEEIDVVATFGSGPDALTESVVTAVPVVAVSDGGAALGGRFVVITVALEHDADVLALSHAVRSGQVVVVRATGARPWSWPAARSSGFTDPTEPRS